MRLLIVTSDPARFDGWIGFLTGRAVTVHVTPLDRASMRLGLQQCAAEVAVVDVTEGSRALRELRRLLEDPSHPGRCALLAAAPHSSLHALTGEECDDVVELSAAADEVFFRMRRSAERATRQPVARQIGPLTLHHGTRQVLLGGEPIPLRPRELALLQFLCERPNRVFLREVLAREIWGPGYAGSLRTVDTHVARIRRRLGRFGQEHLLTVRGVGYRLSTSPCITPDADHSV